MFYVHPLPAEMIQFDQYFSNGLKPPTSDVPSSNQKEKQEGFMHHLLVPSGTYCDTGHGGG